MPTSGTRATDPGSSEAEGKGAFAGSLVSERDAPVGGQAVLEGVMMRGVSTWAVAVRKPLPEQVSEHALDPTEAALGEIEAQGFLFSRPVPADAIPALIARFGVRGDAPNVIAHRATGSTGA